MEGEGRRGGVELDFSLQTGEPCAAKVIGFYRNGWAARIGQLAQQIGKHLETDALELAILIERAVE